MEGMYADKRKHEQLSIPKDIPLIELPEHLIDTSTLKWREVEQAVKRARASSAPGPNGVSYQLNKNAPDRLHFLWRLMAWNKGIIPKTRRRSNGVLIPKEKDSTGVGQFCPICLLNAEGKIFFSVMAQKMSPYLESNNPVDTNVHKAGIQGSAGCLDHTNMIWHEIQKTKEEKKINTLWSWILQMCLDLFHIVSY